MVTDLYLEILKTIPPELPEESASIFNSSKKKVICSICDHFTPDNLPEWFWVQSLTINDGGLGLKDSV